MVQWSTWHLRSSRAGRKVTTSRLTGGLWEFSCMSCSRVSPPLPPPVRTTHRKKSHSEFRTPPSILIPHIRTPHSVLIPPIRTPPSVLIPPIRTPHSVLIPPIRTPPSVLIPPIRTPPSVLIPPIRTPHSVLIVISQDTSLCPNSTYQDTLLSTGGYCWKSHSTLRDCLPSVATL